MEPMPPAGCKKAEGLPRVEVVEMRWWRLLTVPLAATLVVVGGCAVGGDRDPAPPSRVAPPPPPSSAPRAPVRAGPLVGVFPDGDLAIKLTRLDPRTLRPLGGGGLGLEGAWPMLAVAPDRSVAVLGGDDGDLAVVDLVHLRRLGAIRSQAPSLGASGWSWAGPSRLLLFGGASETATEVAAVDIRTRRVVRRQRLDGVAQGYARLPDGLALLTAPADAIGQARLVVSDPDAGLRMVTLAEINAGFRQLDDTDGSGPRMEQAVPGIAADPAGRSIYVVPGGGPVAAVDLATLRVTYHRLGRSASPLERLARWWAPPAEAKVVSGPSRNALWLGDGRLAVTGYDGSAKGHHREVPSGLELIDTASWTSHQVDRRSSGVVLAARTLLAFGTAFGTGQDGANQGYGLTLYGPGDRQPVHRFGEKQVSWVQTNGDLVYVQVMDANLGDVADYAVLDLRSGRVLHEGTGDLPQLLVPDPA
jgi:hypothetical protein